MGDASLKMSELADLLKEHMRYQSALELIASGTLGPSSMRAEACAALGKDQPVWDVQADETQNATEDDV